MSTRRKRRREGWEDRFLEALKGTGIVRAACLQAGIDRKTAYNHYNKRPDFAEAWDDAIDDAADALEAEALRRAKVGTDRVKVLRVGTDERGRAVFERINEKEFSDLLLIFLLKAARPEKYRERYDLQAAASIIVQNSAKPATGSTS